MRFILFPFIFSFFPFLLHFHYHLYWTLCILCIWLHRVHISHFSIELLWILSSVCETMYISGARWRNDQTNERTNDWNYLFKIFFFFSSTFANGTKHIPFIPFHCVFSNIFTLLNVPTLHRMTNDCCLTENIIIGWNDIAIPENEWKFMRRAQLTNKNWKC